MSDFSSEDIADLRRAVEQLESLGFFIKVVDWLGKPIEYGIKKLPQNAQEIISNATRKALTYALDAAITTMDLGIQSAASNVWHKVAVSATGAVGGVFGLGGLAFELPVSTSIMLRSIADVGRAEGEDLRIPEARIECVSVFGMGGRSASDDAAETAYYAARIALARAVSEAAAYAARRAVTAAADEAVPALVRLITRVSERFAPQVTEKAVAMGVPIIGAVGGATLNYMFIDHFQSVAHGHFTVRRLDRKHGPDAVKSCYETFAKELKDRRPKREK